MTAERASAIARGLLCGHPQWCAVNQADIDAGHALHDARESLPPGIALVLRTTQVGWSADIESARGPEIDEPVEADTIHQAVVIATTMYMLGLKR
jgi:hypothetical protein